MPLRKPRPRRLSRTAVEQAVRETETRDAVSFIHPTYKFDDGTHRVEVILVDIFRDPREESPAVNTLIEALEADGWTVAYQEGALSSRLVITETTNPAEED